MRELWELLLGFLGGLGSQIGGALRGLYVGGPAQSFPPVFFSGERPNFFEALGRTKKQTDREQHKALFLTT